MGLVSEMLLMESGALPWLVRVIGCTALSVPRVCEPKLRLLVVRAASGEPPVPVILMACGLPRRESAMLTAAVKVPEVVGVKVAVIVHVALAANELGQLLV